MSEELPEKLLDATTNEDTLLSDDTDASNLSDEAGLPVLPEVSDMPTDSEMLAAASEGIISMEGTDMVEERLHDSLESQESHGHEEWLSEDVLTDDDFNQTADTAASQISRPENHEASPNTKDVTEHEAEPEKSAIVSDQVVLELNQAELEPKQAELEPEQAQLELEQTQLEPEETELEPEQTESMLQADQSNLEPEQAAPANTDPIPMDSEDKVPEQNIEDALNTLEGGPEKETVLPDLDSFLIKKSDEKDDKFENTKEGAKEEDDGNDTDDLLRMLGEDNSKSKKLTKTVKDVRNSLKNEHASSDDDDFVFEGASAKKLKLSKMTKKLPPKAEPEEMDEDAIDQSSDEKDTLQKMFNSKKSGDKISKTQNGKPIRPLKPQTKDIVNVIKKDRVATSTPLKTGRARSLLKTPLNQLSTHHKKEPNISFTPREKYTTTKAPIKTQSILKLPSKHESKKEPDTIDEEFLEDEDFHLPEEEFDSDDDEITKNGQRIMRPEKMDEDMPSDGDSHSEDGSIYDRMDERLPNLEDSHSEDGSLYDELPSSESDDGEDWFQLDIRAEKAGDYLPLLGPNAKQLLLEEKHRVGARLGTLKQSLRALTDSGKKQADEVRTATMALAELDDMLKAS